MKKLKKVNHIINKIFVLYTKKNLVQMMTIKCIIKRERDHCHYTGKYRGVSDNVYNLRYKNQKKISVVFHNGSTYDYYIIMEELGEQFKGHFECSGENTEKYITFSIPIKR